ncbi:unnamed protein product [Orchesella dallaii]|uniref:Calcium release-activated calcium channel protein 1 n=1 Tax=Orchesella dallaii TaxID=48710 RepID=A0ABP1RM44_9HEXA
MRSQRWDGIITITCTVNATVVRIDLASDEVKCAYLRYGREGSSPSDQYNTVEYLSWRRLHLSKSKLKNVAEMASFMAGFAVVGTVELQINDDDVNPPLLCAFVITTALLVGTCMIAIIISTCILPHLEAVAKTASISDANQSPHDKMMRLIDISWVLTNSASLFFFTLDVILMSWIKYKYFSLAAAIAATVIMAPVLIIIIAFSLLFYRRIIKHQYVISSMKYEELEKLHRELERVSSVHSMSYQNTITSNYKTWIATQEPPHRHNHHHHYNQHHHNHSRNPNGGNSHMNADSRSMVETPLSPTTSSKSLSMSVITV